MWLWYVIEDFWITCDMRPAKHVREGPDIETFEVKYYYI